VRPANGISGLADAALRSIYRGAMRWSWSVVALVLLAALVSGCQLGKKSNDCVGEPGLTAGGPSVCTKPPPAQFSQLGN